MEKTDRELLELAAKAAGIKVNWVVGLVEPGTGWHATTAGVIWEPLDDNSDAFELAVKCGIGVMPYEPVCVGAVDWDGNETVIDYGTDPCAATRRAIVIAAAMAPERPGTFE